MLETVRELQPYILAGAFVLLWIAEGWIPHHARASRWWHHAGTNLLLTLLYVAAGIGFGAANAWMAQRVLANQLGLLHWLNAPAAIAIPVGVLALDFAAYAGHIVKHRLPLFWRFHRVHHSDAHLDVTTGFRFHPVEALISWLFLAPAILLLGISGSAIVIFAGLYAIAALIQHANVKLPVPLDKAVRWALVSPAFHRVHHSPHRQETDSNYAALFSFWDRLFQTYHPPERSGEEYGLSLPEADSLRATLWEPLLPARPKPSSCAASESVERV